MLLRTCVLFISAILLLLCRGLAVGETDVTVSNDAGTVSTIAKGVTTLKGKNIDGARQTAIRNALRQAIEQGVGTFMDATSMVRNEELLDNIYTHTEGYIKDYRILREGVNNEGLYEVTIEAKLKTGALRNDLEKTGILKAMMDFPRIVVIPESETGDANIAKKAETELVRYLTEKRFDVVDASISRELHTDMVSLHKYAQTGSAMEKEAARIGLKHHAELVLLYHTDLTPAEYDGVMERASAAIRGTVIVTSTAQILSSGQKDGKGVATSALSAENSAIRSAASALSEYLARQIERWWDEHTANGIPFNVVIESAPSDEQKVLGIIGAIEGIPGVSSVVQRTTGGGVTELMVRYKGSSLSFRRAVLNAAGESLHTVLARGRFIEFSLK